MANVWHISATTTVGDQEYSFRPLDMTDKAFFQGCLADFPFPEGTMTSAQLGEMCERLINRRAGQGELKPWTWKITDHAGFMHANVFLKGTERFGFVMSDTFRTGTNEYHSEHKMTAVHPDHRGEGLLSVMSKMREAYARDKFNKPSFEYETPHSVTKMRQYAKDKELTHDGLRTNASNNVVHHFKQDLGDDYYDEMETKYTVTYTEELVNASTDSRYATAYRTKLATDWETGLD